LEDDKGMVWVDCRKTRAVVEEWRRTKSVPLKSLLPANRLQSVTGMNNAARLDFARVRWSTLHKFVERSGPGRCLEEFIADPDELGRWRAEQESQPAHSTDRSLASVDAMGLQQLHERLCGYYELYHNATSRSEAGKVSLSLLHVYGLDAHRGAIKCELHDSSQMRPYFHLVGHVRAIHGFLDWSLGLSQELIVCHAFSYLPVGEKYPNFTLCGIFLVLSGDERLDYPVAARGALRFLGESASEATQNSIVDCLKTEEGHDHLLKSGVGGYLSDLREQKLLRSGVLKFVETNILPKIDNVISTAEGPRGLIVPR
jgi:hypothetical protein